MKNPNHDIKPLLDACSQRESWAQMELYNRYSKAMFNVALRILDDPMEAEDMMQEAFLKAFDKIDQFSREVSFGAWLKKIVVNKSLTQLKKNKHQNTWVTLDEERMDLDTSSNESSIIDYSDLKVKQVKYCIERLKENYRIVLSLNLIEGYDLEEIAQIMDLNYGNVRVLVSRAKSKLKSELLSRKSHGSIG